jgi:threonine dehydrogenase-like Zn-dependent dehydrogenase
MLAARYLGPRRIEPVETPVPVIEHGEALIRVDACGFCGSDIGIISGVHPRAREPLTVGHEFCGRIDSIKTDDDDFKVGDYVTLYPLISCGHCYVCRNGNPHVCRTLRLYGFDADGGMAEYVRAPVKSLIHLPEGMLPSLGAIIEPLAVAVHGMSRVPLEEIRTAVVMGAGPIGLLSALVARARGVEQVIISDLIPFRRELAASFGLTAVAAGEELREVVEKTTSGEGADLVLECAAGPGSAQQMTAVLRPRGTIVNLGVFKKPVNVDMQAVNFKELTILGSRVYSRRDFVEAVELASQLPLQPIVTHSFALRAVKSAFDCFEHGEKVCKVLVLP